jgi:outer membrane biosynthesis protein TonB
MASKFILARRRGLLFLVALALLVHLQDLGPTPEPERPRGPMEIQAPPGGLPIPDLQRNLGSRLDLGMPTRPESEPNLHVAPATPGLPHPIENDPPSPSPAAAAAELAGLPPRNAGGSAGRGAEAAVSLALMEMALRPLEIVHPRVPARVIRDRKIDDTVILQALVGDDGGVRQVRLLHTIPNCEECTASALAAARQYRFEPPFGTRRVSEVWTVPFDIRFSWRR